MWKTCVWVWETKWVQQAKTCTIHFCGRYINAIVIMIHEQKAFLSRTILKIISKIGTYSYCTPLLICVGDCATVLVVWLPIILKYIIAGEWNGLSHMAHNHVIAGSTPVLQQLLSYYGEI